MRGSFILHTSIAILRLRTLGRCAFFSSFIPFRLRCCAVRSARLYLLWNDIVIEGHCANVSSTTGTSHILNLTQF
ncbi:hypothetical protein C8F01DRAFT_1145954, partial [Mycena amicta]